MTKGSRMLLAALASILFVGVWAVFRTGVTPSGQPPLVSLAGGDLSPAQNAFNTGVNKPRLVLLLSPT